MEGLQKNNNEIKDQNKVESLDSIIFEQPEIIKKEIKTETLKERENLLNSKRNEILDIFDSKKDSIENKEVIKEGLDFVFEQNPELKKIGTKEQYSEYLDSIFTESKVRDIVYRGDSEKIKEYKIISNEINTLGDGIYFTPSKKVATDYAEAANGFTNIQKISLVNPLILDYRKKFYLNKSSLENEFLNNELASKKTEWLKSHNYDGVILIPYNNHIDYYEYMVIDPNKIYILGGKQDLENFKKFVENNQDSLD